MHSRIAAGERLAHSLLPQLPIVTKRQGHTPNMLTSIRHRFAQPRQSYRTDKHGDMKTCPPLQQTQYTPYPVRQTGQPTCAALCKQRSDMTDSSRLWRVCTCQRTLCCTQLHSVAEPPSALCGGLILGHYWAMRQFHSVCRGALQKSTRLHGDGI
jgi:hypothetical protein